jgi:hypothetical protein
MNKEVTEAGTYIRLSTDEDGDGQPQKEVVELVNFRGKIHLVKIFKNKVFEIDTNPITTYDASDRWMKIEAPEQY